MIQKHLTSRRTSKYIDVLDEYNNKYHSSVKMTPLEAFQPENRDKVMNNLVTTMGFMIVTPRVRRATKAPLDGTARFNVCVETTVVTTKVKKQLLLTESQPTTTQNKQ